MFTKEDVVAEALKWVDTPFHHQARVRGSGVDCIGLVVGVAKALNIPVKDQQNYSRYPDGVSLAAALTDQLDKVDTIQAGDILLFTAPRLPRHVAFYTGNQSIIHSTIVVGKCVHVPFDAFWRRALVSAFRFRGIA